MDFYYIANWKIQKAAYITKSKIPCTLESLPRQSAGNIIKDITINITGISKTKDVLMPNNCDEAGTGNGESTVDTPLTSTRLKRFAPMMLPSESDP